MSTNNHQFLSSDLFNVKDRVAVVTGGGSGIGLMCAQALAVNGARVYLVGRTKEKLDKTISVHGKDIAGELIPMVADITKKSELEKLVQEIKAKEKCICVLINNAGISGTDEGPQSKNAAGGSEGKPEGDNAVELKKNLFEGDDDFDTWTDIYRVPNSLSTLLHSLIRSRQMPQQCISLQSPSYHSSKMLLSTTKATPAPSSTSHQSQESPNKHKTTLLTTHPREQPSISMKC